MEKRIGLSVSTKLGCAELENSLKMFVALKWPIYNTGLVA